MPIIVRRRRIHRWSIAFVAILALTAATAAFCLAASQYGWLTRQQVSGIGGFLPFVTLIATIYVVMNWIETRGWSWTLVPDDRCVDASREFLERLSNGDAEGAFELTDPATFGEPRKVFARRMASWIAGQKLVSISEQPLTTEPGLVPPQYRVLEGEPFSLVKAEFTESPDQVTYLPTLRLVLRDNRYVVQAFEVVVGENRDDDEEA